jgi:hypothetical protein
MLKKNLNIKVNAVNLAGESASAIEKRFEIFLQQSFENGPSIVYIKSVS